jgi:uncharacterized protein (TIGR03382 family)
LSVGVDGQVRVVWTAPANGDFNVHSFTFHLPAVPHCQPAQQEGRSPIQVCVEPQDWPLLTSVELTRTAGARNRAAFHFTGSGAGVLCVDNGFSGEPATSGWIWLNGHEEVTPAQLNPCVSLVAASVAMRDGDNLMNAMMAGNPGSSFRLRVYGMPLTCEPDDAPGQQEEPGAARISGQHVRPVSLASEAVSSMTFIPEGAVRFVGPGPGHGGCSTGGGSPTWVGLMMLALWWLRPRRERG